jgi:hypothetical protein
MVGHSLDREWKGMGPGLSPTQGMFSEHKGKVRALLSVALDIGSGVFLERPEFPEREDAPTRRDSSLGPPTGSYAGVWAEVLLNHLHVGSAGAHSSLLVRISQGPLGWLQYSLSFLFFFEVLGIKFRASHLVGKCSTTPATSPVPYYLLILKKLLDCLVPQFPHLTVGSYQKQCAVAMGQMNFLTKPRASILAA